MKIPALPFTATDWSKVPATRHPGETGAVSYTHLTLPTNREV
mgnify:CR=1 FL=1